MKISDARLQQPSILSSRHDKLKQLPDNDHPLGPDCISSLNFLQPSLSWPVFVMAAQDNFLVRAHRLFFFLGIFYALGIFVLSIPWFQRQ